MSLNKKHSFKKESRGSEEMVQWIRAHSVQTSRPEFELPAPM